MEDNAKQPKQAVSPQTSAKESYISRFADCVNEDKISINVMQKQPVSFLIIEINFDMSITKLISI